MAFPELIEIVPPSRRITARITIPGSKSITNRALALAALARGPVVIRRALWSEDTEVMVDALRRLGFELDVEADVAERSNRTITVRGLGGTIPPGGDREGPLSLYVGLAGTAARFLSALLCLGSGFYRLHGTPAMHARPQAPLFEALTALGYELRPTHGRLPVLIRGGGARAGRCRIGLRGSSQFASALLMGAVASPWDVCVENDDGEHASYVAMTRAMIETFPHDGGEFAVEIDASSGGYFHAARHLLAGSVIDIPDWPRSGWQIDAAFPNHLPLPNTLSRTRDLGDSIMMAIAMAPLASHETRFEDLDRLRVQECDRVEALREELTKCGGRVRALGDTLVIEPGPLHGAEIDCRGDHRVAMCFATLGLRVPGIRLRGAACARKTFPSFYEKLAAPPPTGLGVDIRDAIAGRTLAVEELST